MPKQDEEKKKKSGYKAEDITVLEGLEPVRRRPGMYIGTTGLEGLHHLIWEVFDNSRDEAMGGFADTVEVVLLPENRVRVVDNGRGIPVDIHKQTKVSALETIMTTLHAGGKFGGGGYKISGGLHGVGVSVVNALSTYLKAEVHRDGGKYEQEYGRGKPVAKVKRTGASEKNGTIVTFEPDTKIFPEIEWNWEKIASHLRQQAYLVKKFKITVIDARKYEGKIDAGDVFYFDELGLEVPKLTFYFEGGLASMVKFYNEPLSPVHKNIFYVEKTIATREVEKENEAPKNEEIIVEASLQYVDDISSRELAFANNTYNPEGGTHLTGFRTALTRTLNDYGKKNNLIKTAEDTLSGDDVREGLTAVISVKMPEVQFEGQTKGKLGSVEARSAVEKVFGDAFGTFLEEHPEDARGIVQKVLLALRARKAAKAAKDSILRKGALEGFTLPGKLADCQTKSAEEAELFVVEGDSAGGCFSGDTKVALTDGRNISFKDLLKEHKQGKSNYCYTIKGDGNIAVAPILHPRLTKHATEVIKIILDNDEEIVCTPDHQFLLRDGAYKKARLLTREDSLAPLYRKLSKIGGRITIEGYEMVYDVLKNFWIFTHILSDQYNLDHEIYAKEGGDHRHHRDFNKLNNNPPNIVRITSGEHLELHRQHIGKTLHRPEVKEKCTAIKRTRAYREKARAKSLEKKELFSKNAKRQWENESYKQYMGRKFLEFYNASPEYRKKNGALLNKEQKIYWSKNENKNSASKRVRDYYKAHPEKKTELSAMAQEQWNDKELRNWRRETTKKQWTEAFREKRKKAYNRTYLARALRALHDIYQTAKSVDRAKYNELRKEKNDKTLIKYDTICQRFFNGNEKRLEEAVAHFNHRIKRIVPIKEKMDVYDLEVEGTHNFALASGVFVHNSAKMGRDRRTQAILPLWGKVLNVERARLDKIVAFRGIKELIIALGTMIGDTFDIQKLRYHKVILATDADVDGAHIRTLLLTLLYRYLKPLVEAGHIYIATPPLYKIKVGAKVRYAYSEEEKNRIVKELGIKVEDMQEAAGEGGEEGEEVDGEPASALAPAGKERKPKISLQRYKGLGEMNPDELWETTMNPETRTLRQVMVEDARDADRVFDILMGTDVPSRKSFIQTHAKEAELDV